MARVVNKAPSTLSQALKVEVAATSPLSKTAKKQLDALVNVQKTFRSKNKMEQAFKAFIGEYTAFTDSLKTDLLNIAVSYGTKIKSKGDIEFTFNADDDGVEIMGGVSKTGMSKECIDALATHIHKVFEGNAAIYKLSGAVKFRVLI